LSASDQQTILDLEFNLIIEWLGQYVIEKTASEKIKNLKPSNNFVQLEFDLNQLDQLKTIRISNESFPALDFEELKEEIKLLKIQNSVVSIEGFRRIYQASDLVNRLVTFFESRKQRYPSLETIVEQCEINHEINKRIDLVFDRAGTVKDDASPLLNEIRQRVKTLRNQINRNFERELRKLLKDQILGDVTDGYVNERRVLSVQSSFKRKVSGNVHGSSKTGNLTYVEPQVNVPLNNEMEFLLDDERKEIHRILKQLTSDIAVHYPLIVAYQNCLVDFDFLNAKCRLALEMDAVLPGINRKTDFEYIDAYHPILRKSNSLVKKETKPQRILMNGNQRMLVISGPNAGGKSITLKTVGLLQLMLQSGLLIPVQENSKACFFQQILSDIGDNQSIENELSTYSYRLQRMNYFLKVSNHRTLLLLDEFGTGSDPELGKEKNYFERLSREHQDAQATAEEARLRFNEKKEHYENRLKSQQSLIEQNNKQLAAGKKMLQFIEKFNLKSRKKDANLDLLEEIKNFMKLEKSKTEVKIQQQKAEKQSPKVTVAKQKKQESLNQHLIKVGSSVQILGTNRIGIVDKIKEKHLEVIFGNALIKVEREKLRFLK